MTGKQLSTKSGAQNMGPIKSPISPDTVRTMGASALDGFMKSGAYGKLSPDEMTAMRVEYHHLVTDAGENARNVDENAAKKMAFTPTRAGTRAPRAANSGAASNLVSSSKCCPSLSRPARMRTGAGAGQRRDRRRPARP